LRIGGFINLQIRQAPAVRRRRLGDLRITSR
jgi:hypothetical protein